MAVSVPAQVVQVSERRSPTAFACSSSDEASADGALFVGNTATLQVDPGSTPLMARAFFGLG